MLKKWIYFSVFATTFLFPFYSSADNHAYKKINAQKLKRWIDEEKEFFIFDARTAKYDDGLRLPHAASLPCDCKDDLILESITSKEAIIVIYCSSIACKASRILSDRLLQLGYTHVYKYAGGLSDWAEKGYPLTQN